MAEQQPSVAANQTQQRDQLGMILSMGTKVLSALVPDWTPPNLKHPCAKPFNNAVHMRDDPLHKIVKGDQIMVLLPDGYFHHGIYVGKQHVAGGKQPAVVDFWGADKERASIGVRSYDDFTQGAVGFAKAAYPEGAALDVGESARAALAWAARTDGEFGGYNAALNNCEVFATLCRCGRYAAETHSALDLLLALLPTVVPCRRGFK